MEIKELQPAALWYNFAALNAVPRASKKEERVIQFMLDYGKGLGLETVRDAAGNVIIKSRRLPVWKSGKR
jgi:dipeptidase D